jgi:hypothetical protein
LLLTDYSYKDLSEDFSPDCFEAKEYRTLFEKIREQFITPGKPVNLVALGQAHPELASLIMEVTFAAPTLNGRLRQVASTLKNHRNLEKIEQPEESKPEIKIDVSQFSPLTSEEIKKTLDLTIKHDPENKLLAFLGMLTAYTEDSQVNIMFNAPSSTGKSYIPTEVARLFPQEDVLQYGGASPTAFFHSGKFNKDQDSYTVDLERKILIFLDQPHDQLLQRLRSLLSHDSKIIVHKITDKTQRGGTKTKTIFLKGYASVVFCTASLKTDEQEATRCFLLSPETSQQKLQAGIVQKLRKEADPDAFSRSLEADPGRRMLKERIRAIKQEHITDILINRPEEELIAAAFLKPKMLKPRHQRDIGRIISLVKVFALLNLWFRDRSGSTITANESDVDEAFSVWEKIAESQELNLAPYVYQLFQEIIVPAFNEKNQGELASEHKTGLSRKELLQKHSKVYGRPLAIDKLRFEILPQLEASGLIVQEADTTDRRNKLIYPT